MEQISLFCNFDFAIWQKSIGNINQIEVSQLKLYERVVLDIKKNRKQQLSNEWTMLSIH